MLNDWNWREPVTDNVDENKYKYKKNQLWKKKLFEILRLQVCMIWEKMKRAQELRVDDFSAQKLRESHETIQRLTSQVQELQDRMSHLNDWNKSGFFHTFPVNQKGFQVRDLC